jgi:hypothetical protein
MRLKLVGGIKLLRHWHFHSPHIHPTARSSTCTRCQRPYVLLLPPYTSTQPPHVFQHLHRTHPNRCTCSNICTVRIPTAARVPTFAPCASQPPHVFQHLHRAHPNRCTCSNICTIATLKCCNVATVNRNLPLLDLLKSLGTPKLQQPFFANGSVGTYMYKIRRAAEKSSRAPLVN